MSSETKKTAREMVTTDDPAMVAIIKCIAALDQMSDQDGVLTVLDYLRERYNG